MTENFTQENSKKIYISRINRVIDYIKANLDGDLSLDRFADVAHFSKFYFHRVFKAVAGENINGFVSRMRIERSAFKLIYNSSLSITSIAYEAGFSSPSVFSREFKSRYAASPTHWRRLKLNQSSKICTVHSNACKEVLSFKMYIDSSKQTPFWGIEMQNQKSLDVEVRSMPEIDIAYVRHNGHYNPQDIILFQSLFAKLMTWAVPRNLFNPPITKAMTIFSSGHPDTTQPENLSVDVCISIEKNTQINGEIGKRVIPEGQYAVLAVTGTLVECGEAWNLLFNSWLPVSGYQPSDGAYYINHLNDPGQHPQNLHSVEMYLPVKPL